MATKDANMPVVVIVRDGWGENPNPSHDGFNAVKLANTPVNDRLRAEWPWTLVKASGEDVGLPDGTMGNSEVGHQNIGAGRIVEQESRVITKAMEKGFDTIEVVRRTILAARQRGGAVHLMGINSDAGVHGLLEHLFAYVRACKQLGQTRVFVHLFNDGRDTGPFTGLAFADRVERELAAIGVGRIASVIGRYYAMDRDNRWERVQRAYACMTGRGVSAGDSGTGCPQSGTSGGMTTAGTAREGIQRYYDHPSGGTLNGDEFVTPTMIGGSPEDIASSRVRDGDAVIFYNYRGDRPREISAAFVFLDDTWAKVKPSPDSGKNGFDRGPKLKIDYLIMTEYWEQLLPYCAVAFPKPPKLINIGGEWVSTQGLRQFRCAETEKYPHVTFFFNDYRDEPFPGETRENPQSPRVATYDMKPEMAAEEVSAAVLRRLGAPDCEEFIVVNFANADMVGHTGNLQAAVRACETVDACVGRIVDATLKRGGSLIVTADHGNAEQMWDPVTKSPHTAHTVYDVPLIVVGERFKGRGMRGDQQASGWFKPEARLTRGRLADILPTVLEMMGVSTPGEMTGESLMK